MNGTLDEATIAGMASRYAEPYDIADVKTDLLWFIEDAIRQRPRSQQKMIGPSEIGHECGRWLGYKLADSPVLNEFSKNRDQWRTQVGVAVHAWLAGVFEAANDPAAPIFVVEHDLRVGSLVATGGCEPEDIYGSCDLWYQRTTIDWKIVGPSTLKKSTTISRATKMPHGPSGRYRKQVNTYAKGWVDLGLPVDNVMICMLPAAGDLRTDAYIWSDAFDPEMATGALARVNGTNKLVKSGLPLDHVLGMLPAVDAYCTMCPYYQPNADRLSEGCPGGPKQSARVDPIYSLAPQD